MQFAPLVTNPPVSRKDLFLSEIANLIKIFNRTKYFCLFFYYRFVHISLFCFFHLKRVILQRPFFCFAVERSQIYEATKQSSMFSMFFYVFQIPLPLRPPLRHNPESSETTLV